VQVNSRFFAGLVRVSRLSLPLIPHQVLALVRDVLSQFGQKVEKVEDLEVEARAGSQIRGCGLRKSTAFGPFRSLDARVGGHDRSRKRQFAMTFGGAHRRQLFRKAKLPRACPERARDVPLIAHADNIDADWRSACCRGGEIDRRTKTIAVGDAGRPTHSRNSRQNTSVTSTDTSTWRHIEEKRTGAFIDAVFYTAGTMAPCLPRISWVFFNGTSRRLVLPATASAAGASAAYAGGLHSQPPVCPPVA